MRAGIPVECLANWPVVIEFRRSPLAFVVPNRITASTQRRLLSRLPQTCIEQRPLPCAEIYSDANSPPLQCVSR